MSSPDSPRPSPERLIRPYADSGLVTIEAAIVWALLHGEERNPGAPLVESLQTEPLSVGDHTVEGARANPEAAARGVRFIDVNLALGPNNWLSVYTRTG
jgi:hypothetical protein